MQSFGRNLSSLLLVNDTISASSQASLVQVPMQEGMEIYFQDLLLIRVSSAGPLETFILQ
jgi:hypothetical protein